MLADTFAEILSSRSTSAAATQQARAARDAFIKPAFEQLATAFADTIDQVTGSHALLTVTRTATSLTVANRSFTSLASIVVEVRSTLYGFEERVRFEPALQFVYPDQFGIINITTNKVPVKLGSDAGSLTLQAMLDQGIVMRGRQSAHLVMARHGGFEPVTAELVEQLLTALFVRTTT